MNYRKAIQFLNADASVAMLREVCQQAETAHWNSLTVSPRFTREATSLLKDCETAVCTAIGYPFGFHYPGQILQEMHTALREGTHEWMLCPFMGAILSGEYSLDGKEMQDWVKLSGEHEKPAYLLIAPEWGTDARLRMIAELALGNGIRHFQIHSPAAHHAGVAVQQLEGIRTLAASENIHFRLYANSGIDTGLADRLLSHTDCITTSYTG